MAAITTSIDGDYIFIAAENGGNQIVLKAARTDLTTWTVIYSPGAGTANNVLQSPDPDIVYFYGHFGTDIQVIKHTISGPTNTNISPTTLAAKVVNTMAVNPSDINELLVSVNTDQDLKYSSDGGTTWTDYDTALGFDATALWGLWSGQYAPNRYFVAGDAGATLDLLYSPNAGSSDTDVSGAALGAETNICNVEVADA